MKMTKWRTLLLATAGLNLSFLIWFSFAPFVGEISDEFGLSMGSVGILVSAAMWMAPAGRVVTGWLADRWGATAVFSTVLVYVGVFSIASAFVESYWLFFVLRLVVGTAGITFVVGIQHVAQWFDEARVGTAEGIYAGIGNAGAGVGALALPVLFGANWRAAFVWTGVVSIALGIVYYVVGEDAATQAAAEEAAAGAILRSLAHVGTRYGVVALSLGYVMSFGLVLAMNGWLPTYFDVSFDSSVALAGAFAAVFGIATGVLRPLGGYISDVLLRRERDILPFFRGRYREQWTFVCLCSIVVLLCVMTIVGRTGNVVLVVAITALLGTACGWAGGAIFAQVPDMFPNRTGAAAGAVGGIGTVGGIGYPLLYSAMADVQTTYSGYTVDVHTGYVVVAATMLPIVLVNAWVFRPQIAARANVDGFWFVDTEEASPASNPADD